MVNVIKFSQFPNGVLDTAVGLAAGANAKGASMAGGGVIEVLPMPVVPIVLGEWVRVNGNNSYTGAQGDNAVDGEVIGICIAVSAATFTLQQSGYISTAQAIPGITGLIAGSSYFISTTTAGMMSALDATQNGQISRPVFVADSPTSGWVVPYRGLIVGGAAPIGQNVNDSNIEVVNQNGHGFIQGNVVRVATANVAAAPVQYALAQANSLANSQVAGVVISVQSANEFTLQFGGYNTGAITVDQTLAPIIPSTVYYLSPTVPGFLTSVNPTGTGTISKPVYLSEQGIINQGVNAGYILPQRPLDESGFAVNNPIIHVVPQVAAYTAGQIVYIAGDQNYQLASAASAATAQVAGMVIANAGGNLTIQQIGWNTGALSSAATIDQGVFAPVGTVYYLSDIHPGNLTSIAPTTPGHYTVQVYVQDHLATFTGEILSQRPQLIAATPFAGQIAASATFSAAGGVIAIRSSFNVTSITRNSTGNFTVNFTNPLANTNYYFFTQAGNTDGANWWGQGPNAAGLPPTVNNFSFVTGSGGSFIDAAWNSVLIIAG